MKVEEVNSRILQGLSRKERVNFEAGLKALNMANPADRVALRESFKRLCPDATERELDIMVSGEVPPDKQGWIQ